jgi:hydroxymethylpyrimidine pyrophosphatase-like HAD family hydrolase
MELIAPLDLRTPIAGFNGGIFVKPDMTALEQHVLPPEAARCAHDIIRSSGLDVWVYSGNDWYVRNPSAPHVARKQWTVKFAPTVVEDFEKPLESAVGVSDDLDLVARCKKPFRMRSARRRLQPARSLTISRLRTPTPTRERLSQRCQKCCRFR